MSDLAEDFRAHKQWTRERKEQRYIESREARGAIYREALWIEEKNGGQHWIVYLPKETIDFWPSSGRWIVRPNLSGRKKQVNGYDAGSLLNRIEKDKK
jgi:hypothetical protein